MTTPKRKYDQAFKLEALNLYEPSGKTVRQVDAGLDITAGQLTRWCSRYQQDGSWAFPGTGDLTALDALARLPVDGFVEVNIFATLAVHGGQAIARYVLANLGNILTAAQLRELVREGVLGEKVLAPDYGETHLPIKPKLAAIANPPRRDAWFGAVKERCLEYLEALNYRRYAA